MQHDIKISHIPVIKPYLGLDRRQLRNAADIFEILSDFLASKDCAIVAIGSQLMSLPPQGDEKYNSEDMIFDSMEIFDEAHFTGAKTAFDDAGKRYIWQYLPFFYTGKDIDSGIFTISTIVKLNSLSAIEEFKSISFGALKNTPMIYEHIFHLNSVVDTLVDYYISTNNAKSTFVLPFHPLEHFISTGIDFDEAMITYQEWFGAFQAFSAILQASNASFKVILGMQEWAYTPPNPDELRNYIVSEGLSDVYRSPHRKISEVDIESSDEVGIETISSFDLGNIVTIITWQKQKVKRGQEFYYHVMGENSSIDKLEDQYKQRNLSVSRSEIDIDDNMEKLAMLNISRNLN